MQVRWTKKTTLLVCTRMVDTHHVSHNHVHHHVDVRDAVTQMGNTKISLVRGKGNTHSWQKVVVPLRCEELVSRSHKCGLSLKTWWNTMLPHYLWFLIQWLNIQMHPTALLICQLMQI